MSKQDGIFTQPGPDGIFGRGGTPEDAASPPIDGDGTPLRETLVVAYPSPGHMRVARVLRHPQTGKIVEWQEKYREPTPEEEAFLKQRGLVVGAGSMIQSGAPGAVGGLGEASAAPAGIPWVKLGVAAAVGAAGFWAVNKFVVPMVVGEEAPPRRRRPRDDDDEDDSVEM